MRTETGGARNHSQRIGHTHCLRSSAGSWRTASPGTGALTRRRACQRQRSHPPVAPGQTRTVPEICPLRRHRYNITLRITSIWLFFSFCRVITFNLTHQSRREPEQRPVCCSRRGGTGAGGSCGPVCSSPGTTSACCRSESLRFTSLLSAPRWLYLLTD